MKPENTIEKLEAKIEEYEKKISPLLIEIETYKISLEDSEKLHNTIVNNSLDGTLIIDEDGLVSYANQEMYNFLGYKDIDFLNKNFNDFINDILEEIKVVDKSKHKLELSYSILDGTLSTDKNSLKHILQNLLTNACKYSPEADKVDVIISETEEQVKIEVQDYGIGIPEEDQKQLFETFHRASNVGTIQGTGLGLAIVKRSVNKIKGEINLESESGKGSKFILEKPKNLNQLFK